MIGWGIAAARRRCAGYQRAAMLYHDVEPFSSRHFVVSFAVDGWRAFNNNRHFVRLGWLSISFAEHDDEYATLHHALQGCDIKVAYCYFQAGVGRRAQLGRRQPHDAKVTIHCLLDSRPRHEPQQLYRRHDGRHKAFFLYLPGYVQYTFRIHI